METPRTIPKAYKAHKEKYPESDLTEWAIRDLVRRGEIPALMRGWKYLITEESIERYVESQLGGGAK